ncbi:hypothetical protein VC83_07563 [Pseudogymnoascus destructans]|uniref:Uncharacterized protein n=1 Tax=Pseudogymnoascus destructans TaxID=655981 RepID=A0A177A0C2_9PEZI|nr:uncharacterized protein VC83_07563 [Pseudogymnoascus destructans]OAF55626.1 hypothetical protein VC83_07563 [Pseudogymnoascus destructans]
MTGLRSWGTMSRSHQWGTKIQPRHDLQASLERGRTFLSPSTGKSSRLLIRFICVLPTPFFRTRLFRLFSNLLSAASHLSKPAKHMYRSTAQFSAWELARAQKREIESLDDDAVSVISRSTSEDGVSPIENELAKGAVGKAGDPLPPFHHHMIQHRVDRHGNIFELAHASELPGCTMPREEIGSVKPGPARRWMAAKAKFDQRFAREKRKMQRRRIREMGEGYEVFVGETPPPSALAGRRVKGKEAAERKRKTGWGLGMWSLWGSEHDKQTIQRELNATNVDTAAASPDDGAGAATRGDALGKSSLPVITDAIHLEEREHSRSRSNSRRVSVMDRNQTGERDDVDEDTPAADLVAMQQGPNERAVVNQYLTPEFAARRGAADGAGRGERDGKPVRPKAGGKAFPFSARGAEGERPESAASMATLISEMGVRPVGEVEQ